MLDVEFPLYKIGKHESIRHDESNILYIHTGYNEYILDNPNLGGSTLSARRRKINDKDSLYKFRKTIFDFAQLIKQKGSNFYMDSTGKLFKYRKEKYYPIIYRKIINRRIIEGKGTMIKVQGIEQPILVSNKLALHNDYAGLILYRGGYILYELVDYKKPDTRKKI